uniref:Uncharacterized protein n=1 Tax=Streptomyces sp. NBC_00093 TaxID=2975649 RepID=A0AAU1ZWW0_9ACTN
MARRHPTGWEVLGFSEDPTPGDPEAIRNLSRNYRELGDGAGEALGLLRDDGRIRQGKGQAMDALKERIKELPGMLEDTRDSFQRAATAYDDYANTLTEAQSMLDRAIDQGQEVAATANAETPAQAPPDATPEQVEAREGEVNRINGAKQQLSAAQSLGRDAERLREDGSRRASVVLDDAASKAIPERGALKKLGDFLADNPFLEIIAGILVGIISVFLPFVGVILGAIVFAFTIIRMASQGKFDVGEIVIGLLTLVPGGVLLGGLGKLGLTGAKVAKFAPFFAKLGKGAGTISAGLAKIVQGSTFIRKIINPLSKGLAGTGLKITPGLALAGKVGIDVATDFGLGLLAAGITAKVDKKKFDIGGAALGGLVGAATGGLLGAFGGTKFANSIKNAFTIKGKFKSNIDKAFSPASLGITNGTFKPGDILFVNGLELPQKIGFNGINSSTTVDAGTGALKTKVSTPDGTKTEAKLTPAAQKPDLVGDGLPFFEPPAPVVSTKTTTPDGFTSETTGGTNTIKSPVGDVITSNGTQTTITTPLEGPGIGQKASDVAFAPFAPGFKDKPTINTELTPGGGFTTSGSFGDISTVGNGGPTVINPPTVPGADPAVVIPPNFTIDGNGITTPSGITVNDQGAFTTVSGDGFSIGNGNNTTSVFNNPNPANGAAPVITHDPATGVVDIDLGNNTVINANTGIGNGSITVNGGSPVDIDNAGNITVTNNQGGNQTVTVPPANSAAPVTVVDGNVTTSLPPGGGATITTPNGAGNITTTLDNTGFTVNTGAPNPSTVQFNGPAGTLDVTPGTGQPITVSPDGGVQVGGITTNPNGGGTIEAAGKSIAFTPDKATFTTNDTSFDVGTNGAFDVGNISQSPTGTITTPTSTTVVNPDGSAVLTTDGQQFTIGKDGTIAPIDTGAGTTGAPGTSTAGTPGTSTAGAPGTSTAGGADRPPTPPPPLPQPAVGSPVTLGDATIGVDGTGGSTITFKGDNDTTVSVNNGNTTVKSGSFQVTTTPNGITATNTTGFTPVQFSSTVTNGGTTFTAGHGNTTVSTGTNNGTGLPTTVTGPGTQPGVTVTPAGDGNPTTVTTTDGSTSTLTGNGAHTDVGTTPVASAATDNAGALTTQAPAGGSTTVVNNPDGTTVATDNTNNTNNFGVGNNKTVTDGTVTIAPGTTGAGNTPTADITNTGTGTQATLTNGGIDSQGITTSIDAGGNVTFTNQPAPGAPTTTTTSSPDGSLTTNGPDNTTVQVPNRPAGPPQGAPGAVPPAANTITNGNGSTIATDGTDITLSQNGFTTKFDGNNGTVTTVSDKFGVGHQVDPAGQTTVLNSPSKADIAADNTQVTVNTPANTGFLGGPKFTGGENTLSNGPNGPTITTHGATPVAEPGTTVVHGPNANGPDGEFSVTYGPAKGEFAPGGVTGLGPAPGAVADTVGNPVGTNPGDTQIGTATGNGQGAIEVPAFDGGGSIKHEGGFNGKSTVDTGTVTISKSPGTQENPLTAGQKSGVVDGPLNPIDPAPANGPETFTVGGNGDNGPSVEIPVQGGGSTVHGGGDSFDVKSTGDGTFEVSVPGSTNPGDTVIIGPDGTLTGPNVITPPPPVGNGPVQLPTASLSNGTTVTGGANPFVTSPQGTEGPTAAFNNGTATTTNGTAIATNGAGTVITQNPDGTANFQSNVPAQGGGNQTTNLDIANDGVSGTVTTTDGAGNQSTFNVDAGESGAIKVKDGAGQTTELDASGGFQQNHSPVHDYYANTGGPDSVTDLNVYGYEAVTSAIKGAIGNLATAGFQIAGGTDQQTALENAGIKTGLGVGNSLANKKLENDYIFKTKAPEVAVAILPTKFIAGINNNEHTDLNPAPTKFPTNQ